MNKIIFALILLAPSLSHSHIIALESNGNYVSFGSNGSPSGQTAGHMKMRVDSKKPLEIFDLVLNIDNVNYYLDKASGISYQHEIEPPGGFTTLNASGLFLSSLGDTAIQWGLHLEFPRGLFSYMEADFSVENFFSIELKDKAYMGTPFYYKVPEPSTLALLCLGFLGLSIRRRYSQKEKSRGRARLVDRFKYSRSRLG
ncbi:PEP-CTERM sorting domain-containing protein [Alkalimarinus coralli]|uniref:PEP-CTERM sorting domain-containing protein n=1 Tax=Alkalimarinus coralli TaxID=2935863 RepID=UPI00202AC330|nr:PEP-CTERM sorting domain-containing protein [Alkalimarinus coralli]